MAQLDETLREELLESADELLEQMNAFARLINQAGSRDSDVFVIKHFASYHLADLEGQNGGWLGGPHLKDALVELSQSGFQDDEDDDEEDA